MYFSKIQLRPDVSTRVLPSVVSVYQQHKLLWTLFGDHADRRRDFLFREERDSHGRPYFLSLSERQPQDAEGIWEIQSKIFTPVLEEQEILEFSLRANPTVCQSNGNKQHRHDVVMHKKMEIGWKHMSEVERPPLQDVVHEAVNQWLSKKAPQHGFEVIEGTLVVDGYQTHSFSKKAGSPVQISTVDLHGLLRVIDGSKLIETMQRGFGRSKAFGCGMLMVRRV